MKEQEKLDIINRKIANKPSNWKQRSDTKKFGWGSYTRKNRRRQKALNFINTIRKKIINQIPLTEEDIKRKRWYNQLK